MPTFSKGEKERLQDKLVDEINLSQRIANQNRTFEVVFRVSLLLLSIATTIFSALSAANKDKAPPEWILISAILAGISTLLSSFAFTQFDFTARRRAWERRADGFRALHRELEFSEPESTDFLRRLTKVHEEGDPN